MFHSQRRYAWLNTFFPQRTSPSCAHVADPKKCKDYKTRCVWKLYRHWKKIKKWPLFSARFHRKASLAECIKQITAYLFTVILMRIIHGNSLFCSRRTQITLIAQLTSASSMACVQQCIYYHLPLERQLSTALLKGIIRKILSQPETIK